MQFLNAETNLYYYRARYYDPAVGRFLAEDPVRFDAGAGFYRYVRNNPILLIDPTGFWATLPPDPSANTIVCDGHGRVRVQIGKPGTPQQAKCLEDCMKVHEEQHIADVMAVQPKICKGKSNGVLVGPFKGKEQNATEIAASNAELDCLRKKMDSSCDGCGPIILQRIQEVEGYRDSFKN